MLLKWILSVIGRIYETVELFLVQKERKPDIPFPVSRFIGGIKNIAPSVRSGGAQEKNDERRWCMLIYNKAREQSPEAANALLQIQIACGLWLDR